MKDEKKRNERMQELYNELADSILELSDETIIAKVSETGIDPDDEAESVRLALRESLRQFDAWERYNVSPLSTIRRMESSR